MKFGSWTYDGFQSVDALWRPGQTTEPVKWNGLAGWDDDCDANHRSTVG
ncbi:hypothetical protein pipiens_020097, partial [Culex pipiens pipiens]